MMLVAAQHVVLLNGVAVVILSGLCTLWSMLGQQISGWPAGLLLNPQAGRSSSSSRDGADHVTTQQLC